MVFKVVEKFYISLQKCRNHIKCVSLTVTLKLYGFYLHLTRFKFRCTFVDKFFHITAERVLYTLLYKKKAGVIKFFESISRRQFNVF